MSFEEGKEGGVGSRAWHHQAASGRRKLADTSLGARDALRLPRATSTAPLRIARLVPNPNVQLWEKAAQGLYYTHAEQVNALIVDMLLGGEWKE